MGVLEDHVAYVVVDTVEVWSLLGCDDAQYGLFRVAQV